MEALVLKVLGWLTANPSTAGVVSLVLMGLGTLYVLGTAIVKITPSKTDDEWLAKFNGKFGWFFKYAAKFSPLTPKGN